MGKISNRDRTVTSVTLGLQMKGDSTHSTSQDRKDQITARVRKILVEVSEEVLEAASVITLDLVTKPFLDIMTLTIGKFESFGDDVLCKRKLLP